MLFCPRSSFFLFSGAKWRNTNRVELPFLDVANDKSEYGTVPLWGRTGFDLVDTPEAACRGWFVGLVKNRTKKLTANQELALAA